jgi:hypothetical protein
LLALSHYRSGSKPLRAYFILKGRQLKLPKSKYLLGKCCLDLNKYGEAEYVLTNDCIASGNNLLSSTSTTTTTTTTTSSTNSKTSVTQTNINNGKFKLYDEIIKEYGSEYAPHVLQILATVYAYVFFRYLKLIKIYK